MSLKHRITALAEEFSTGVLAAIRAASLEEILSEGAGSRGASAALQGGAVKRGPGRPRGSKNARLARRSPEQIAAVVESIVGALRKNARGMRSEQLQKLLNLDKREIAGPLSDALDGKKITKKGQRRATTYFAR
jgi:hypothetical protein